jgi:predicted membrane protein (TIGR00267 family)
LSDWRGLLGRRNSFSFTLGISDGILTALTLASGRLLTGDAPELVLGFKIAAAASLSGVFVFCTAEYARLRHELIDAERQLNLTSHGRLATSHLGRAIRRETAAAAIISSLASFVGAFFPLAIGAFVPQPPWLSLAAAIAALGLLGGFLAYSLYANVAIWAATLMLGGLALAIAGAALHIV